MSPVAVAVGLLAALATPAVAQSDSAAVIRTIEAFRAALASGDSTAAIALLAPGATIVEGGGVETLAEYRSHHLPADIQFASGVPHTRGPIRVTVAGDVAWATSTSIAQGEFRSRAVNSASAELMVLRRRGAGWLIEAVHWSSRARR